MRFSTSFIVAAATALFSASLTLADPVPLPAPVPEPVASPVPTTSPISEGCYSSSQGMTFHDTAQFQTSGLCAPACVGEGHAVIAINGTDCWCGDYMPPSNSKVDDSKCDTPCPGFGTVTCGSTDAGGPSYWTVWNAGIKNVVVNIDSSSASASSSTASNKPSSTSTAAPSVVTIGGQTVFVTPSSSASSSSSSSSSGGGPSKAGIAAGVVVGVVAIAAIAGGVYLYIRARRRREVEEEYKRQAAISSMANSKPSSAGGFSVPDSRLDPTAARRFSDGSIADNQDYSRKILRVTNA